MMNELKPQNDLEPYKYRKGLSGLFLTSMIIGFGLAIYIYLFNFDNYSETVLVRLTALWLIPIVFAYYGFFAQWMFNNYEKQQLNQPRDLLLLISQKQPLLFRFFFYILHFPLFIPNKTPLFLAFSGSVLWSVWMLVFFEVIFPAL